MSILIAVAGGTGSGKSTLCYALQKLYPEKIGILHFDDFQKLYEEVPVVDGIRNWDEPAAIDWDSFLDSLKELKSGEDIHILTKNSKDNPDYESSGRKRIPITVPAKNIILVEGYMALLNDEARALYDYMIFLKAPHSLRMKRRDKVVDADAQRYFDEILEPMHEKYVEPTSEHADLVVDVAENDVSQVIELVKNKIEKFL